MKKQKKNSISRKEFLKNSALSVGAIGALGMSGVAATNSEKEDKEIFRLSVTGYPVDRVKGIVDGSVKIGQYPHKFTKGSIGDINTNIFSGSQDFDIAEIGLHPFMLEFANNNFRDYFLLPIFPLRVFRHKSVFVNRDGKVKTPKDLLGKRIGTPGYSSTSLTWLRGIFQDEYGVSPKDVTWVISQKDSSTHASGNISSQEQVVPDGIKMEYGTPGKDESELLLSGEVDALFHAAEPAAYAKGDPNVIRLFQDSRKVEQEFYQKTGIFPIMHGVVIRKSLAEQYPDIIESVYNAYNEAKDKDFMLMKKLGWAFDSLPWFAQEFEATKSVMGEDYWPYGIKNNRKSLEALFRYSYEQGLASKHLTIEEIFHPSLLNT